MPPLTAETIAAVVDHREALAWLRIAVQTNSVTGHEETFARMVTAALRDIADEVHTVPVTPGRSLVWSRTHGRGEGPPVLLVAHLDTVPPSPLAFADSEPITGPIPTEFVGDQLWGRGVADDKGGIAVALAALRALHRLGVKPAGDVITLWVPDEESGIPGLGRSVGMRHAVALIEDGTIPRPEFAVYLEPTSLDIYAAQIGFLLARIAIEGSSAYFAYPEEGTDALAPGVAVATALQKLGDRLRARHRHPLLGPPALLVTEMRSGGLIAVPETCEITLIRSLLPWEDIEDASYEIRAVVGKAMGESKASLGIEFSDGRDHPLGGLSAETDVDHPLVAALRAAVRTIDPERGKVTGARYWSEMSFLTALGIPTVYFAPGDIRNCHTDSERLELAEFRTAIPALALFLACHSNPLS